MERNAAWPRCARGAARRASASPGSVRDWQHLRWTPFPACVHPTNARCAAPWSVVEMDVADIHPGMCRTLDEVKELYKLQSRGCAGGSGLVQPLTFLCRGEKISAAGLLHDRPIHAAHQTHLPPPAVFHDPCFLPPCRVKRFVKPAHEERQTIPAASSRNPCLWLLSCVLSPSGCTRTCPGPARRNSRGPKDVVLRVVLRVVAKLGACTRDPSRQAEVMMEARHKARERL